MKKVKQSVEFEEYYIRINLLRRILIAKAESIKMQFFMSQTRKCIIRLRQLEKSFQLELNYINLILNQQYNLMLLS